MGRKRIIKIPKSVKVKCPKCGKNTLMAMPKENIYFFEYKKCKNRAETPQSQCCVLCAYGNSPCAPHLLREALRKGLTIKYLKEIGNKMANKKKKITKKKAKVCSCCKCSPCKC